MTPFPSTKVLDWKNRNQKLKRESESKLLHNLAICLKMVNKRSTLYAEQVRTPYIAGKMLYSCNEHQKILTTKYLLYTKNNYI